MSGGRDGGVVRHREMAGWLFDGAERIAMLQLEEFDPDPDTYWQELWYEADGLSGQAADAVEAMREAFGGSFASAADWGSIVLLSGVWIAPACRTRLDQGALLDTLLQKLTPAYGLAVLVAHPAGFEHVGDLLNPRDTTVEGLGAFEWRQRAQMRFYQRTLGFTPFVVREARPEVMWRARPDVQHYVEQHLDQER